MNSSAISSVPRSPQHIKSHPGSTQSSDEIPNRLPQRPPRSNRQRADSLTSQGISATQYYQHYYPNRHNDHYVSTSPPSSRPSPSSYGMSLSSQPSSPMSFQLPPSALSPTEDDPLRSNSVSFNVSNGYPTQSHPIQIPPTRSSASASSSSSYRTPRLSPGMNGNGGIGGMAMSSMPPLSLPVSFLEEQSDYSEYYSDVSMHTQTHHRQHQTGPIFAHNLGSRQEIGDHAMNMHGHDSMFLPSPLLSPTTSPVTDFSSLCLDDSVSTGNSHAPQPNTEAILVGSESYYHGNPQTPIETFLTPTQEQYPPDSVILYGGTASLSESSIFRKDSKEYLLLTNSSLLKYKSMEKAVKVFGNQSIWSSSSGNQLLTPQQTSQITKDHRILSVNSIVGVHSFQTPGSELQIHIEYLVSISSQPASMCFTPSSDQAEGWLKQLRQGCNYNAPLAGVIPKGTRQRQWVLDKLRDDHIALPQSVANNDPTALTAGGMWRAYFMSQKIKGVPMQDGGSNELKVLLENKVIVIAIGKSYVHLLPHNLGNGSTKDDMKDERLILQYPLLTTKAILHREKDDTFSLVFGTTLRQRRVAITFASARAREIIIAIRARVESLRWLYPHGRKGIELSLSDEISKPIPVPSKEYMPDLGFEDLLRAECFAMNVERKSFSNVKIDGFSITIGKVGDNSEPKRDYMVDEMKCLMRALRFNTTFKEISFKNISFATLQKSKTMKDGTTRYGLRLDKEFYELVIGNPQLKVLDLRNCNLDTSTIGSIGRAMRDGHSSGLRLEYLDLFGNNASDGADVMTLAKGIVKHAGTLHCLDVGNCNITGDGINQIMHAFVANPDVASHTLESFGIQGNEESKVNSFIFDMFLKHSMRLECLNISGLPSWSKSPILMAESLANCGGFLASLDLSGMAIHPSTLDQILTWISSPSFQSMKILKFEGCGLDGLQFASILDAVGQTQNSKVEVHAGKNLLSDGNDLPDALVNALASGDAPTSLNLRQTCWSEQALRQLFVSLGQNWCIKKLDLSAVSLASNRDPDVETCKLLGQMLSTTSSRLEELNLQGEETSILTSRMGKNLWRSFYGVGQSRYLTRLDVRRNRFRDEGAHAIAEALRTNQSLVWLDMDENDVTLDGFNAILSAFHQGGTDSVPSGNLYYNGTLCYFELPIKDIDRQTATLKESMLDTYKTEQETRFLLSNSTGKDSREWKERLAQIIRTRNQSSETISRLDRTIKGIATATERNKAAQDAVQRDRERRRDQDMDRERERERERTRERERERTRERDSQYYR
ncbi:hypothetical protein BGZ76_010244 [Entomortierella beljakovae]|nr:hypothetical protein BGZ76_010244 [Entomortierella beljakovae]